jgi:hypothetical protein
MFPRSKHQKHKRKPHARPGARAALEIEVLESRQLLTTWGPWISSIHETWHQAAPYNVRTPLDPSENASLRSDVGCVATAAAQVVNYWRFPEEISFSSLDSNHGGDAYLSVRKYDVGTHGAAISRTATIQIDGNARDYDFPTLADLDRDLSAIDYTGSDAERALLSFGLGVKYETRYSSHESEACVVDGEDVFRNDLGYGSARWGWWEDPSVQSAVIRNLKNGWPVLAAVSRHDSNGLREAGHAVILEGYRDDDAKSFYVNFGWGNRDGENGWYDLPLLDPPAGLPHYDTVELVVRDINPLPGWSQFPPIFAEPLLF